MARAAAFNVHGRPYARRHRSAKCLLDLLIFFPPVVRVAVWTLMVMLQTKWYWNV